MNWPKLLELVINCVILNPYLWGVVLLNVIVISSFSGRIRLAFKIKSLWTK